MRLVYWRVIVLTFFFLSLLSLGLEGLARTSFAQTHLLPPAMGGEHYQFEVQAQALQTFVEKEGGVDCILLGSSMAQYAFQAQTVSLAYQKVTGSPLRCFSFGVSGLNARTAPVIAEWLVAVYHPRWLVWGLSFRDMADPSDAGESDAFNRGHWMNYHWHKLDWRGWLIEHSVVYRYYLRYRGWSKPTEFETMQTGLASIQPFSSGGYANTARRIEFSLTPDSLPFWQDYQFASNRLAGLERMLQLQTAGKTNLLIVDMPIHEGFIYLLGRGEADREYFWSGIRQLIAEAEVPFWITSHYFSIPQQAWADYTHLRMNGALAFSHWLGTQFGTAVISGDWSEPPLDLPLDFYDLDYIPLHLETLQGYEPLPPPVPIPPEARVFDPSLKLYNALDAILALSGELAAIYPETDEELVDWLVILNQVYNQDDFESDSADFAALTAWRNEKTAANLAQAGFEYLFVSEEWLSFLTAEEFNHLTASSEYRLVRTLIHSSLPYRWFLYQLLPDTD